MNAVRAPAVVILLALLVGAVVFAVDPAPVEVGTRPPAAHTELSLDGSTGDVWFCLGPAAGLAGIEEAMIVITSLLDEPTEGIVTVVDERGGDVERSFRLDAGEQLTVRADQTLVGSEFAGVTVEAPAGRVLVEQHLRGVASTGVDRRSCTTATAGSWQLPWATTERPGTRQVLLLHNPFRATAVADLRFVGDLGRRQTLDSTGVVVPGRSVVVYELTERIPDSMVVSSSVQVRSGQLLVAGLQMADGTAPSGLRGLAVIAGSPEPAGEVVLPGPVGDEPPGLVVLLNPGDDTIEVEVVVLPADEEIAVEPFQIILRSGQRHTVDLGASDRMAGVGPFSLRIRSLDAPTLTASLMHRTVAGPGDDAGADADADADADAVAVGLDVVPAVPYGATTWLADLTGAVAAPTTLIVLNAGTDSIATVEMTGSAVDVGLPDVFELDPGDQASVVVAADTIVTVTSSTPVVVYRRRVGPEGRTADLAVSVEGTVARSAG